MPITVKTFATPGRSGRALSADRAARFLGGGTLVMRALNEGDMLDLDRRARRPTARFAEIRPAGARVTLGAGVTMAQSHRRTASLRSCTPVARAVGGPAIRNMATVGGNLFAPRPYGDFTVALLALDATRGDAGRLRRRATTPLEEFLANRERGRRRLVASVTFNRPRTPDAFRFRKVARVKPKGISVLSIAAHLPLQRRAHRRRARRLRRDGADADARQVRSSARSKAARSTQPASRAAAAVGGEGHDPATDAIASAWYRREIVGGAPAAPAAGRSDGSA